MSNFGNYAPESFGWTRTGQFTPYSYKGVSIAPGINPLPAFAVVLTAMLDALVPHIPGGLVPGWNWGGDTSDRVSDSFHLFGTAVDLNAPVNPMTGGPHTFSGVHVLPANTGELVRPFGFEWGGNWSPSNPPDYMHLESQLAPSEVTALAATLLNHPVPAVPVASGRLFPLPGGYYFGLLSGPQQSISGMSTSEGAAQAAHRTEIGWIQTVLNRALLAAGRGLLAVDSSYGPLTMAAVQWFQSTHGLGVDGLVGPATWAKLGI